MLTYHGKEIMAEIAARCKEAQRKAAEVVLEKAKAECPVDTGLLRQSGYIVEETIEGTAEVVFSTPYAVYVELGTSRKAGNPFLGRALAASKSEIRALFDAVAK